MGDGEGSSVEGRERASVHYGDLQRVLHWSEYRDGVSGGRVGAVEQGQRA